MANEAFKALFGSMWEKLPPVFLKRYSNRSLSNDITTVKGNMDISYSKWMACFMPIFRLLHILVPYQGNNIPVKVDFRSEQEDVCLDRIFYFAGQQPYLFNSRMHITNDNEVIEYMSYGFGWKSHYFYDGSKVLMEHKGYVLKILGINVPLPISIIIGKGYAEEIVVDDNTYHVNMTITHPLLGLMYRYSGDFSFTRLPA